MKHYTILRNDVYCGTTGTLTGNTPSYWDVELEMHDGSRGYYDLCELSEMPSGYIDPSKIVFPGSARLQVKLKQLTNTAITPKYATDGSACFDIHSDEDVIVSPGQTLAISTGLSFELPVGYQMKVLPRSGLSVKTPLRVIIGTVDSDYRGEVKVILWNTEIGNGKYSTNFHKYIDGTKSPLFRGIVQENTYVIRKGDRIAQAEVIPVTQVDFAIVDKLSDTQRGSKGFGSSGV